MLPVGKVKYTVSEARGVNSMQDTMDCRLTGEGTTSRIAAYADERNTAQIRQSCKPNFHDWTHEIPGTTVEVDVESCDESEMFWGSCVHMNSVCEEGWYLQVVSGVNVVILLIAAAKVRKR
jgi:hypothetical protein